MRVILLPCALGVVLAVTACVSTPTSSPQATPVEGGTDAPADGVLDAGVLDAGGPLTAPFTCPADALSGPHPDDAVFELLRLAAAMDSVEERVAEASGSDAGILGVSHATAGSPCSQASDRPACKAALAQLSNDGEALYPSFYERDFIREPKPGYWLAYTKKDTVGKVSNAAELHALFPTVDSPVKVLVYAEAAGYRVECHNPWLREEADGYVILASRGHEKRCTRSDVVLFVGRDGRTQERAAIENVKDGCS
jgi:hypothetical protein